MTDKEMKDFKRRVWDLMNSPIVGSANQQMNLWHEIIERIDRLERNLNNDNPQL